MRWSPLPSAFGDIIRTKVGTVYHYGIFVSENEVIQFGFSPDYYVGERENEKKLVCISDVYTFMKDGFLEKGVPEKAEKKKKFSPQKIVERARARLGEGGYNILHNNCEHFVNECAFGKKYSEQEEILRKKWNERPKLDLFISFGEVDFGFSVPKSREKETSGVNNEKLKSQKTSSWQLLSFAAEKSFGFIPSEIKYKKTLGGKWVADKFFLSLSHTDGCVIAAVSNAKCGIDVEKISKFTEKCKEEGFRKRFSKYIDGDTENETELLKIWTAKESNFKRSAGGLSTPVKTKIDKEITRHFKINDYLFAVAGENVSALNLYLVQNANCKLLLKGEVECL